MSTLVGQPNVAVLDAPRLGFLGVGWIGRNRLQAIAQSGVATVAAIADASRDVLREVISGFPNTVATDSLDGLLGHDLDGIVIATPSALHADQAMRAIERGVAVFCQKPLGRDAEETRRVVDAARETNVLLGVDLSYRYVAAVRMIRDIITSGQLGRVFAIDLTFHNAYGPDKPWFYDPVLSGGGCVIDLGIHMVDLALWVLGSPRVLDVSSALYAGGAPLAAGARMVEDYAIATIRLEPDVTTRLACSWRLNAGRDACIEATFYGTLGGARMRNLNGSFYDFVAEKYEGTATRTLIAAPDAWGGRAAVEWARRLRRSRSFDPSVQSLIPVAETIDRIYQR